MINYKGLFFNKDAKKLYYEGGAHFKYKDLYKELEVLKAKRDEEESEKKHHTRNKSIDYFQEKEINIKTNINNYYNYDSPKRNKDKTNNIEQLLSLDKINTSKNRKLKLKEIKTDNIQKESFLYTDNNRYNNNINNDPKIRSTSLDINILNDKNNYMNKILLSDKTYDIKKNTNNNNNLYNLKLFKNTNPKSYKNLNTLTSLPKIESLYFNNISKRNIMDNSNSNLATDFTNKRNDLIDPNQKMELEINKNLNLPDSHFFSLKKKIPLPQLNLQTMSSINNNDSNKNNNKNRLLFIFNKNKREDFTLNNEMKNTKDNKNEKEIENINDEDVLKSIDIKKHNHKILKLINLDKEKKNDLKSKLFDHKSRSRNKKSHKKSVKKSSDD